MVVLLRVAYAGDEPLYAGDARLLDEMLTVASLDRISTDLALCDYLAASEGDAPEGLYAELDEANALVDRRLRQAAAIRAHTDRQ